MKCKIFLFAIGVMAILGSNAFSQNYQWAESVGGTNDDSNRDLALDNQGNVYITGCFQGINVDFDPGPGTAFLSSAGGLDIFLAKYDSLGNYLWAGRMGGANNDYGARIAVDASGNVCVIGWFESTGADFDPGPGIAILNTAGYTDIFFAKYDANGIYLWAHSVGGTNYDGCHDIVLDSMNNVFITGYFYGTNIDFDPGSGTAYLSSVASSGDLFYAKYDSSGTYLWAKGTGGSSYEVGNAIALDDSGNVYLTGPFSGTDVDFDPGPGTVFLSSAGGYDVFLAKYDASGDFGWVKRIGGAGDDIGGDIVIGGSSNLYISGCFHGTAVDFDPGPGIALLNSAGEFDAFFAKYNLSGDYLWAGGIGGVSDDYGNDITLDGLENVLFYGSFQGTNVDFDPGPGTAYQNSAGGSDAFFAKYDASGNFAWAEKLGGQYDDYDGGAAIDAADNIHVAGNFSGINVDFDCGPGTAYLSSAGGSDIFLAKYSQPQTAIKNDEGSNVPAEFAICQNYPNPFNPTTTIEYQIPSTNHVTLKVHDLAGREVAALVNDVKHPGIYSVRWDASDFANGIYFYRLQAGNLVSTRKLVLLR
ncbi:MAG: T9SS type A sorting domain-containing protein [bacterium]|nr:T9SS type A sorting domain-containing protein [bacterium]